ncbi:PA3371 family protein [Pseudomonas savastanoi]|uniref:Uncharacterized protein n=1 Tax=Pseudomonas savastanoi TaxID=29438 RepID=A0A3M6AKZ9_PSESS|nr:PA3371 family protein [Pseudomonas savastanoi]KPX04442.1 Uncharacterized protein ALO74_02392 [Pseudomonas syringae pv. cunninghamiae]RMV13229.1 hypothetical protein ALP17_00584 [Pseudomonas savastanoi]RMV19805.1 hypothetical protein ALP16_02777 [Pseudomonas savastanoi]RMV20287.1 hypothetical protein ALP15_02572 [Pseudomonas savastanoi]
MSKSALSFLVLAIMAVIVDLLLPVQHTLSIAANIAAGVFASLFVVALFLGRRIKFDPVLR